MQQVILPQETSPFCLTLRLGATTQRVSHGKLALDWVAWASHRHTSGLTDRTFASAADILGKRRGRGRGAWLVMRSFAVTAWEHPTHAPTAAIHP